MWSGPQQKQYVLLLQVSLGWRNVCGRKAKGKINMKPDWPILERNGEAVSVGGRVGGGGRGCHCLSLSLRLWIRVTVAIRDHVSRVRAWMPPPLLQTSNANERLQLIRGVWRREWYTTEASDDTPLFSLAFICYDFGPHKIYLQDTRSIGLSAQCFF
jgi:hypothetical protein